MKNDFSTRAESFNPEDAQYMLTNHNYVGQRAIRKPHVNFLANEILNGRFREGTAIGICHTPDGKKHLVNGQHTLSAVIACKKPVLLSVESYECRNMEEVARIFATYDRQRTRTSSDVFHAYGLAGDLGLTQTQTGFFCAAINFLIERVSKVFPDRKASPEEIIQFAEKMKWRFDQYTEATSGVKQNGKNRSSLIALALVTAGHSSHYEFWNGFTQDDGLRRGDPRKHLIEFNRKTSLNGSDSNRKTVSVLASFKAGAYCWNRFIANQPINSFQFDKALAVTGVNGTPYRDGFGAEQFHRLLRERF